ncbi:cysteine--tRNA ligase [Methylophilaceae bacterium]|nr:cysteine--tRNA ligase [Methylophilaceae bacterium]MDC1173042.1 cysteine--tRNA ligase [Methylophilaceae bacterium]
MLKIFNSFSKKKEVFKPIKSNEVRMYVCGMTVYDYCHLGHARVLVVFDLINRWLKESEFKVLYVRNITDVDDKIIAKSIDQNIPMHELTTKYIDAMNQDAISLGVIPPDIEPKATDHIVGMIQMIKLLIDKGFAYLGENNDVYYSVSKFKNYGKLSGKLLDDLRAGDRVVIDNHKENAFDFVLWKSAKGNEPSWESPWGKGRPGWHIECSVMSNKLLGSHFDIHGGGQDLQFPHHENEIAQSEAANDCKMANYWIHNGFVKVDDEKMSKSLGNFFTIRSILEHFEPEVIRFFILKAHYRSPLNYSDKHLEESKQGLTRLYLAIRNIIDNKKLIDWKSSYAKRFKEALDDDFNSAEALAVLYELANKANKNKNNDDQNLLLRLANIIGILNQDPEIFLKGEKKETNDFDIDELILKRVAAKKNKDFAEADKIRIFLESHDILLEDTSSGTIWRKK